jgi:hypothetical protein
MARPHRLTLVEVSDVVDGFVARQLPGARRIEAAPWIDALEARSALRFPPSFRHLVTRHAFEPFGYGELWIMGNRGAGHADDLDVAPTLDGQVARCLFERGFLPVGRVAADPVAFEVRARPGEVESALVRLERARIVEHGEIRIVRRLAPSFLALVA